MEEFIEVKLKVINNLGTFNSDILNVNEEQYQELVEMSKTFWMTDNSFSIWSENGGAFLFPPDIIRMSILEIEIIK